MRSAQPAEIPTLHPTRKPLADRGPGHVDELTDHEMIGSDLGTDRDQFAFIHPELGEFAFRLNLCNGEIAARGLCQALRFAGARAELQRDIAVFVLGTVGDNLAVGEAEHRDWHMLASVGKDAGHPDLLCDYP